MAEEGKVTRHTEAELRQLASDIFDGKVFTHIHIIHSGGEPEDIKRVFMPLFWTDRETIKMVADILAEGGLVYEYMSKAGPRAINGMPNFLSCKLLCGEEASLVTKWHDEMLVEREKFLSGEKKGEPK